MGMFEKDKEIGTIITSLFPVVNGTSDQFILHGVRIKREDFPTNLGPAVQSELKVSTLDAPTNTYVCTTLGSAIASKVREAEADDFPAVVMLRTVGTKYGQDALVIQFLKPYDARERNPSAQSFDAQAATIPVGSTGQTVAQPTATDDIPF